MQEPAFHNPDAAHSGTHLIMPEYYTVMFFFYTGLGSVQPTEMCVCVVHVVTMLISMHLYVHRCMCMHATHTFVSDVLD